MFYVTMHFSDAIQKKKKTSQTWFFFFGMLHDTSFDYIACALISVLILGDCGSSSMFFFLRFRIVVYSVRRAQPFQI